MNEYPASILREDCLRVVEKAGMAIEGLGESAVLVSGGSGFMGGWLAETIYALNDTKKAEARLFILARDKEKFERLMPHIARLPFVDFIRSDVRNVIDLPKEVTHVIHAAGSPDNRMHATNAIETMLTIAEGTRAMLRAADRLPNLRMFVNVSSSSVYGPQPPAMRAISEQYAGSVFPSMPGMAYAEAKRYGEALVTAARSEARMPVVTVRPFTFIGAYQPIDAPWAANNFMHDALSKRAIRILGDGKTVRSLMYGADMAVWLLAIMMKTKTGQVYNIGSDEEITLEKMAGKIASRFRPEPEVVLNASLTGSIPSSRLIPRVDSAIKDFKLSIYTDLDMAIERSVLWYKETTR